MPFLIERLAEDRAAAGAYCSYVETLPAVLFPPRSPAPDFVFFTGVDRGAEQPNRILRLGHVGAARYLSRFGQLRVRNDAAAKEVIMVEHRQTAGGRCSVCVATVEGRPVALGYPCPTLICLTWSYIDHPEFDAAWEEAVAT